MEEEKEEQGLCWLCHQEIKSGVTSATIHTGCMALVTYNYEVLIELKKARKEGYDEGIKERMISIDKKMAAWSRENINKTSSELQKLAEEIRKEGRREGYEQAVSEVKVVYKVDDTKELIDKAILDYHKAFNNFLDKKE